MKYCIFDPYGENKRRILDHCEKRGIHTYTLQEDDGVAYFNKIGGLANRWGILFTDEPVEFDPSDQMLLQDFQTQFGSKESLDLEMGNE